MSDTVSDDAATQFAASMASKGLDAGPTLARFGRGADGKAVQQTPATPAPALAAQGKLTPSQMEQAADALSKNWTGDPAALRDGLQRAGLTEVDDGDDTRTPAQRQIDDAFPPGNPGEYELHGVYSGRSIPLGELPSIDADMRQALAAMNWPKQSARALVSDLLNAGSGGYNALTNDAAKAQFSHVEVAGAIKATGATSREEFFATARLATDRIRPAVAAKLAQQNVFESRNVLAALYMHGLRRIARQAGWLVSDSKDGRSLRVGKMA